MTTPPNAPNDTPSNRSGGFDFEHNPTWRIFRIMSEFVEGFTFLAGIERSVTLFGSARLTEDHPAYQLARQFARRLAESGYTVVTGGGPGIMQAGNQGASEGGGNSIGLNIELPHEQRSNPYVKYGTSFNYFFSRKVMLDFSAEAFVFFPGGFGTLDELFEVLTLAQTGKIEREAPIILMGSDFWSPLLHWMEQTMLKRYQTVTATDLRLWTLTDDIEQALSIVSAGVEQQRQQRVASTGHAGRTADDTLRQATRHMTRGEQ